MRIGKDKVVFIHYTLTGPGREVIDTTEGREALAYLHGAGNIIPGLEQALEGRSAGEAFSVVIPPEQAYGQKDERLIQSVPRAMFSGASAVRVGMQFQAQSPAGPRVVRVVGMEADAVRVDANHPLAGMALRFDITVVSVRNARPDELSHGHVHGPGGHSH